MRPTARLFSISLLFSLALFGDGIAGIWTGQVMGRNGEKQDIAFRFKPGSTSISGVMFGDEFDLPVEDLKVSGDHISFSVTTTNYYDGRRTKLVFSGTVSDKEMQLTRDRAGADPDKTTPDRQNAKQTITLKKLL